MRLLPLLSVCIFLLAKNAVGQTLTCPEFSASGPSSSGYNTPTSSTGSCPAICSSALTSPTYPWDGAGLGAQVIATVPGPGVTSLTVAFSSINNNDYAVVSINGGGTMSLAVVGVGLGGDTVGPYLCGGGSNPYGDAFVTITSTLPFTQVTFTNVSGTSGWVINCPGFVPDAGADNAVNPWCGGAIDMDTLLSGAYPGGSWSETTSSGQFNTTTAVFNAGSVPSGTYNFMYIVTDCGTADTANFSVTVSPSVSINQVTITPATCGNSDGAISINASGGTPSYQYSSNNGTSFQSSNSFSNMAGGIYNLVVKDNAGCQKDSTVTISVIGAPVIDSFSVDNPTCAGACNGSITVHASGGTPPYVYQWFDASSNPIGTDTVTLSNLCGGNYTVQVSNAGGGGGTTTVYFENFETNAPGWTLNVPVAPEGADPNFFIIEDNEGGVTPPGCGVAGNGDSTLHITSVFNPPGGAAYDAGGLCGVLYCPEAHRMAESPTINTTGILTPLNLNFDFIANGDIPNDQATVWYNSGSGWTQLGAALFSGTSGCAPQGKWTAYTSVLPASCNNIANLQVAIRWDNNDDGVGTDPSVAINNLSITTSSSGSGTCSVTGDTTLITPSAIVADSIVTTPPSCNAADGTITIYAHGGTGAFTYSINNGSSFQASNSFSGLASSTYQIVVKDANACQLDSTITLNNPASPVINNIQQTPASCGKANGSITINASGGVSPLNYSIDSAATYFSSNTFNSLAAGNYSIFVKDGNGCTVQTTVILAGGSAVVIDSLTSIPSSCGLNNGSISIHFSGGTPIYSFSDNNGITFGTDSSFTNLGSGNYVLIVKDAVGCSDTTTVQFNPSTPIKVISIQLVNESCNAANGSATITASGGVPSYAFSLNGGTPQTSNLFDSLTQGTYPFQVTDQAGCVFDSSFTILATSAPTANATDTSLCGLQFQITGTTGNGGIWSSNSSNITFSPDASNANPMVSATQSGVYTITYTFAACNYTKNFQLTFIPLPETQINDTTICSGEPYTLTALNLPQNSSYLWNTGSNESSISLTDAGIYWVTAYNVCGQDKDSATISIETCDIEVPNVFTPNNDGSNDYFKLVHEAGVNSFSCQIVNRWGNPIIEFNTPDFEWNGNDKAGNAVAEGVYFYLIKAKTYAGKDIDKHGFVQLLRK